MCTFSFLQARTRMSEVIQGLGRIQFSCSGFSSTFQVVFLAGAKHHRNNYEDW